MPLEVLSVDKVITSLLKNDAELISYMDGEVKLFVDAANENQSTGKWIIFELFNAPDSNALGGYHILSRPMYLIKVCNRDLGYAAARQACDRIHNLLTKEHHGNVDGVWVGKFVRTEVMRDVDEIKNLRHYWIGQLYMLIAHEV